VRRDQDQVGEDVRFSLFYSFFSFFFFSFLFLSLSTYVRFFGERFYIGPDRNRRVRFPGIRSVKRAGRVCNVK